MAPSVMYFIRWSYTPGDFMTESLIGLAGVIIGILMAAAKDIWVERRSRWKNAEYLAIRIVCMLDRFVEGCAGVVGDDGLSLPNGERVIQVSEPKFEIQSLDVDWKSIPADLMYEILSFPTMISSATHRASEAYKIADPPEYAEAFEERQYQYASLGLKASQISVKLHNKYHLPTFEHEDWDLIEYLREKQDRIKKMRTRKGTTME